MLHTKKAAARLKMLATAGSLGAAVVAMTTVASALPQGQRPEPRSAARDFGVLDAAQRISITVHLKRPNQALFDRTVDALYDRSSPLFHHWLTDAQLARLGPPAANVAAVRAELERSGLSVVSIAADRSSVRAVGTVRAVSRAFHTSIHQYLLNGTSYRANTSPAHLAGVADTYVSVVSGLESHTVKNMLARAENVRTKKPLAPVALSKVLALGGFSSVITDEVFGSKKTFAYTTAGGLPKETDVAEQYDPNAALFPDYTPKQLQGVLGLPAAYARGLDGAGQTIVLLEGYGYPNILADANAFNKLSGLPQLNSSNFSVVYPEGTPNPQGGYLTGWYVEIALDIDWAHAIAPGAKIVVVATNGQDSQDFEASMQYITDHHLGNVVSDSWEEDVDTLAGPAEQEPFEYVLQAAAAKGISFQFSTGDSGDDGFGTPVGSAGVPSVAPHATAVGGTAIGNIPGTKSVLNLAWGDVLDVLVSGNAPLQPDSFFIGLGGGGGGSSTFWPKPAWQAALPGFYRQTPDVSALADPYTGVPIVVYEPYYQAQQLYYGYGGTSLASPIFTALWAIANQRAGHPLGQASPTIAALKSGIIDVLPSTAPFSVTYTDASDKTEVYHATPLFSYLEQFGYGHQNVFATIWDEPQYQQSLGFAFGYDTSLTVTPGWDNATGYGTPHGLEFIDAAASY